MIETGKMYDCFDSCKIELSRRYKVLIARAVKPDEINDDVWFALEKHIIENPDIFDINPEYLLEAISYQEAIPKIMYMLPDKEKKTYIGAGELSFDGPFGTMIVDDVWFCNGMLDIDGSLLKIAEKI